MKKSLHVLLWFLICLLASCTSQLHDAARDGDIKTARELLRQGTDIHLRDSNGATPLHLAAGRGNNQMVRFLLEQGADVNAVPKGGSLGGIWEYPLFTPLADAAYHGHYDTINLLLDNGANVDIAMQALSRNNSAGARSGVALLASIEQKRAGKRTQAAQRYSEGASISESPPSDIDRLPLLQVKQSRLAYAIVVGIEKYRQKLPKASFASRDARLVYEYLTQTMGYPKQNVVMLDDEHAALGDLIKYFEKWLPN
ncbi:MAG: ankyrin repeat domain-containing protein, partial [Syntrophales bacterium]|nr:ankyrin repeat domain-containing protein [Syntrophales bacterium]